MLRQQSAKDPNFILILKEFFIGILLYAYVPEKRKVSLGGWGGGGGYNFQNIAIFFTK